MPPDRSGSLFFFLRGSCGRVFLCAPATWLAPVDRDVRGQGRTGRRDAAITQAAFQRNVFNFINRR